MKLITLFVLTLLSMGMACKPCKPQLETQGTSDFLVFGRFYGECAGEECIELFKLENGKLYEDTKDDYPSSGQYYMGNFLELPSSKYEWVHLLEQEFPAELWKESSHVIGQPDAGDWGGLYIEYYKNGRHGFWLLDQMKDHVPSSYHPFIDVVNAKVDTLR